MPAEHEAILGQRPVLVCIRLPDALPAVLLEQALHLRGKVHISVPRRSLGVLDDDVLARGLRHVPLDVDAVFPVVNIGPFQTASLSPPHSGVNRQGVEGLIQIVLLWQIQEAVDLLISGDHLCPRSRLRQVNHPGGVLLNNFIPLGVTQHCRDSCQVFLGSCLLNRLAMIGSFP